MIKDLYLYLFLAFLIFYFYYIYKRENYVEGYRDAKVYIGESDIPRNNLLFMNDKSFGWHTIYEVGKIDYPEKKSKIINSDNVYGLSYGGVYENNYTHYYNYS
jgi:hypothetical protein